MTTAPAIGPRRSVPAREPREGDETSGFPTRKPTACPAAITDHLARPCGGLEPTR